MAYQSLPRKQFILLTLTCWILAVNADENKATAARQADSHLSSGVSDGAENTTKGQTGEDEDFPTWIVVIVAVVVGFIIVSCCLCIIKIRRWRKDQGTYSIWNEHQSQPNVESMYARESGVIFEKLDLELNILTEDQCYEIPVDSFITPQRVYIGGIRVTPTKESLEESLKSNEKRMSESAKRMALVDDTVYCTVLTDHISRTSDVTGCSSPNSVSGDTSKHSSMSFQTDSPTDRVFTPGVESPNKETYCKPLPVIVADEPVTCETYKLSQEDRVSALVNRPLPRTPPFAVGSSASLDRSLLRQQHEERLQKPKVVFQTLPRPRKIRQLHLPKPLVSAITRSSSSSDVTNKEARGLKDHVAYDTNDCTLTKMKKRLSQSLDTLLTSQRTSHFYENPYLMLSDEDQLDVPEDHGETLGDPNVQSQYPSVPSCADDDEELSLDKEHLYSRISTYMDTPEVNLNRHSYASVHYADKLPSPLLPRPSSSRHTYISVVFGSADSVFESPSLRAKPNPSAHRKSRSCTDLSSVRRSFAPGLRSTPEHESPKNRYVNVASENCEFPRVQFSRPHNSFHGFTKTNESSCSDVMDGIPNDGFRESNTTSPGLSPSAETKGCYQNVNEALDLDPSFVESPTPDSAGIPSSGTCGVVHRTPNCPKDVPWSTPSTEGNGRYANVNAALDVSFVSPNQDSASIPSSGTCGVVHRIPNCPKDVQWTTPSTEGNGRYANVNAALDVSFVSPNQDSASIPSNGTCGVVHRIPNCPKGVQWSTPSIESNGRYVNVNEASDVSFVTPNQDSASIPSNGTCGVVHRIPNCPKGVQWSTPSIESNGRYVNVNEASDVSFVTPTRTSASTPSNGTCGVVHSILNGSKDVQWSTPSAEIKGHCVPKVNEFLDASFVSPISRDSPCNPHNDIYPAVPCIPNRDYEKLGNNREHLIAHADTKGRYENVNAAFDVSFVPLVPNCSAATSSSSDGRHSVAQHSYDSATTANGDSSYLADNSCSVLGDSSVFSERNFDGQVSTTSISTRNTESSNVNESYYGVPKSPIKPLESFNGSLGEPLTSSDDGGTIQICNKYNGVALNGLDERQPRTLSKYLEGRLGKELEHREDVRTSETETQVDDDFDKEEHTYENYISNKRQSCESRASSSDHKKLSSAASLGIEEKESESEPLISKYCTDSDVNGNAVCDGFVEKLELRSNSTSFHGNQLSDESVV